MVILTIWLPLLDCFVDEWANGSNAGGCSVGLFLNNMYQIVVTETFARSSDPEQNLPLLALINAFYEFGNSFWLVAGRLEFGG